MAGRLETLLSESACSWPERVAVEDPQSDTRVTYSELEARSNRLCEELRARGVEPGDRVAVVVPKTIDTVAWIFGVLKAGASYVPVDSDAPVARARGILDDCSVSAVIASEEFAEQLTSAAGGSEVVWTGSTRFDDFHLVSGRARSKSGQAAFEGETGGSNALAYILYTSGSTGKPKGVMHSHATARAFVDWCSAVFEPTEHDRFSSHAPFHFDLSIFDLFVAIKHGAAIVLIGEEHGKSPMQLAATAADRQISVWYSTPTVLRLMVEYGRVEKHAYDQLRLVLFAGETFSIGHLRRLKELWREPRFFNLYGPTETNVCTYYEIPPTIPEDRTEPYPIGRACSGDRTRVVSDNGETVAQGEEGELIVAGGSVMLGYWNRPDLTAEATLSDEAGTAWYRTGDVVREDEYGEYVFRGRRDRMVKRRGYRVELGEIEVALYRHDRVLEVGAVATADEESGVTVTAFLSWSGEGEPSLIDLRRHCAANLPAYMIPDRFVKLASLPKTSTDKIDYQRLKNDLERLKNDG